LGGDAAGMLLKRSFALAGHRTSVALEPEFWRALEDLAAWRGCTLLDVVRDTDQARDPARNLASALRVLALDHASDRKQVPS
jgi:predicted DNA-binding ribbon-helix-helix protein